MSKSVLIIAGKFNDLITRSLVDGAKDVLKEVYSEDKITLMWVPGHLKMLVLRLKQLSGKFDAVICLGAVIRGATAHFDYVAGQRASGFNECVRIETETL